MSKNCEAGQEEKRARQGSALLPAPVLSVSTALCPWPYPLPPSHHLRTHPPLRTQPPPSPCHPGLSAHLCGLPNIFSCSSVNTDSS